MKQQHSKEKSRIHLVKCGSYHLVEARRIELRSILDSPSGTTSLVDEEDSRRNSSSTNVSAASRFDLSPSHTGYVLGGISLK